MDIAYQGGDMEKGNQDKGRPKSEKKEKIPEQNPVVIKGIILPVSWDAEGNTTALVISTYKEHEYVITHDEKFSELLSFIRQEVEVVGQIKTVNNRKYITVKEYFLTSPGV